jgi:hypothetical protein
MMKRLWDNQLQSAPYHLTGLVLTYTGFKGKEMFRWYPSGFSAGK